MQINSLSDFLNWVDSFLNFEKLPQKNIFWLDMMNFLCEKLGNPQDKIPCYHIAGSKGKGSVSAMIASILTQAGLKTGVYASPHIEDFRERIRLNDQFFSDEIYKNAALELMEKFETIKDEIPKGRAVTWFELVTVYAFLCIKQANCQQAVYEVGLGGRLDATNVVKPQLCVINTIELEHTEFLGDTLEKIAAEKGGIIKEGIPVLCADQVQEVKDVLTKIAKEHNAEIIFASDICSECSILYKESKCDFESGKKSMSVTINSPLFSRPLCFDCQMFGEVQAKNALLAAAAVKLTHPEISEDTIEKGLSKVRLEARFEIIKNPFNKNCDIILDGAHTVKSISLTIETLEKLYSESKKDLVFACAADKDVEHIARLFAGKICDAYLTKPGSTKCADTDKMIQAFENSNLHFKYSPDYALIIQEAIKKAASANHNLLITGSFYLANEVKKVLKSIQCKDALL